MSAPAVAANAIAIGIQAMRVAVLMVDLVHLVLLHARGSTPTDVEQVWYWIERAKARALVELMGLGHISPDSEVDGSTAQLLADEEKLLAVLRRARLGQPGTPVADPGGDAEAISRLHEAVNASARLRDLWQQLAPHAPDYVALRTAQVTDWRAVQRRLLGA